MTVLLAIRRAIKELPPGEIRKDLQAVERLLDWKKRGGQGVSDTGAVLLYFDRHDPVARRADEKFESRFEEGRRGKRKSIR